MKKLIHFVFLSQKGRNVSRSCALQPSENGRVDGEQHKDRPFSVQCAKSPKKLFFCNYILLKDKKTFFGMSNN